MAGSQSETMKMKNWSPNSDPSSSTKREDAAAAAPVADRISILPDETLASILSLLPSKEAVRTSVLSSQWRHIWTLAALDIRIDVADKHQYRGNYDTTTVVSKLKEVAKILSRHRGPIRSFHLHSSLWEHLLNSRKLDQVLVPWARKQVQCGIQDLAIGYKIPSLIVPCKSLRSLDLVDCDHLEQIIALPPNLRSLKLGASLKPGAYCYRGERVSLTKLPPAIAACQSLCSLELRCYHLGKSFEAPFLPRVTDLTLNGAKFTDPGLSRLLSGCPSLDTLCLIECLFDKDVPVSSVCIRQVTFKHNSGYDHVWGQLLIMDAPNLELLILEKERRSDWGKLKVICAPKLKTLGYTCPSEYNFHAQISFHVNCIEVQIDETTKVEHVPTILQYFSRLETLNITCPDSTPSQLLGPIDEECWRRQSSSECLYHHLKVVNIKWFSGSPDHLGLVRYFVRFGCQLQVMSLCCNFNYKNSFKKTIKHVVDLEHQASYDLQVILERDFCNNTTRRAVL